MTDEKFQSWQREKYQQALAALLPGTRDSQLAAVALYGRRAGIEPEELFDDIMQNAPGGKRPNPSAVRRAVEHAARTVALGGEKNHAERHAQAITPYKFRREPTAAEKREAERKAVPAEIRGTVARLIAEGRGATSKTLREMSPAAIPTAPCEQAAAHLAAIGADWRFPIWAGTIGATGKRGGIVSPSGLADTIRAGLAAIPTHISINPLTGKEGKTKDGMASFDCAETVAAFPFALLEFDDLPLPDQCAIFAAAIRSELLRVVSLCYTGGKSIHAVVLVDEWHDRRLTRLPPTHTIRDERNGTDEQKWKDEWRKLRRLFASSDNPKERVDLAPSMNPAIHTRLGGAYRQEKQTRQTLLYLDTDLARRELEIF
jgi:hypothetical protein